MKFARSTLIVSFLASFAMVHAASIGSKIDLGDDGSDFASAAATEDGRVTFAPVNTAQGAEPSNQLVVHSGSKKEGVLTRFSSFSISERKQRKAEAAEAAKAREEEGKLAREAMKMKFMDFNKDMTKTVKDEILQSLIDNYFHFIGCNDYKSYFDALEKTARVWTSVDTNDITMTVTQTKAEMFDFKVCWTVNNDDYITATFDLKTKLTLAFRGKVQPKESEVLLVPEEESAQCTTMKTTPSDWKSFYESEMAPNPILTFTMKNGDIVLDQLAIQPKVSFHSKELLGFDGAPSFATRLGNLYRTKIINRALLNYARTNGREMCMLDTSTVAMAQDAAPVRKMPSLRGFRR